MRIKPMSAFTKIVDVIAFVGLALFCFLVEIDGPLYDTYVSCDDARYRNPVRPKSSRLVSNVWLYIGVLHILPGSYFATEALVTLRYPTRSSRSRQRKRSVLFAEYFDIAALYYTGALFAFIISKISRAIGGSPAPYFLTLCSPGCSNITSQYTDQTTQRNFITQASCSREAMLPDTLSSFPSLHAVLSSYCAGFIAFAFVSKKQSSYSRLLQPAIVFLAIAFALIASLSRITEYDNHVVDVLGGAGIGGAISFVQVFVAGKDVKQENILSTTLAQNHLPHHVTNRDSRQTST